ncbi:hypothetical protein A9Q79_00790 [Methylophaga sp. 42_25_T18]|nr:hypothetical protein A9Q79_00790 [Methylophaga sp. 42_25_T18]
MKNIIFISLFLFSSFAFAADYNAIPDTFFKKLNSDKPESAIDYLYESNKWAGKDEDQVLNLKYQVKNLNSLVGKYLFHELISEKKVGKHYAHLIYLVGYERQPLRFEIKVYKTGKKWRFQGVSFDAELANDIENQANMNLLK